MSRYFAAPKRTRAWIEDEIYDEPMRHIPTVSDHEATDTGIIDLNGNTFWRAPEPMGFQIEGDDR